MLSYSSFHPVRCSGFRLNIITTTRRRTSAINTPSPSKSSSCNKNRSYPSIIIAPPSKTVLSSPNFSSPSSHLRTWRPIIYSSSSRSLSSSKNSGNLNNNKTKTKIRDIWNEVRKTPLQYSTIPAVAAFLGLYTNYVGVKMLFYPIDYTGTSWYHDPSVPYGFIGWQGVVPCKTEKMASRLVHIVTDKLLSVQEAFGRMEPNQLATLLTPIVEEELTNALGQYGNIWVRALHPILPYILTRVLGKLQLEIEDILDLRSVVLEAFIRDKIVLVELFQKVGRVELDFLVESGLGFGFCLGIVQMVAWVIMPKTWTLPVAGALVGYVTNWIAIKLLFDPAEPVQVGPIKVQGLFESRQVEVSEEFGRFMAGRVLNSRKILESLSKDGEDGELYSFLRRELPYPVPEFILKVAVSAIANAAKNPIDYPELHRYITKTLDIEDTLSERLKLLSPIEFEDLLHPVFQEDEMLLIAAGGILGAIAGLGQTQLGWGGPGATIRSLVTLTFVSVTSWGYFLFKEVIEQPEVVHVVEEEIVKRPVKLRRRNTLVQVKPEVIPDWLVIPEFR